MAGMLIESERSKSMKKRLLAVCCAAALPLGLLTFGLVFSVRPAPAQSATQAKAPAAPVQTAATERALLNQYCVVCHNQKGKKAGAAVGSGDHAGHLGCRPGGARRRELGTRSAHDPLRDDAARRHAAPQGGSFRSRSSPTLKTNWTSTPPRTFRRPDCTG